MPMNITAYPDDVERAIQTLKTLKPGDVYIYYTGFMDGERTMDPHGPHSVVAGVAYSLAQDGRIHLTQKRLSHPVLKNSIVDWHLGCGKGFQYIATGAHPKKPKQHILSLRGVKVS